MGRARAPGKAAGLLARGGAMAGGHSCGLIVV